APGLSDLDTEEDYRAFLEGRTAAGPQGLELPRGRDRGLFTDDAAERVAAARALSEQERSDLLDELALQLPSKHKPWPVAMPTAVNPLVVVIGVSPGNAPASRDKPFLRDYTPPFGTPP